MGASDCSELAFPKSRPRALDKLARKNLIVSTDKAESKKAKDRAKGRCEVFVVGEGRCARKDQHTHHLLAGYGRRGKGRSGLAEHKQRVCEQHHDQITRHILRILVNGNLPQFDDAYERWR